MVLPRYRVRVARKALTRGAGHRKPRPSRTGWGMRCIRTQARIVHGDTFKEVASCRVVRYSGSWVETLAMALRTMRGKGDG